MYDNTRSPNTGDTSAANHVLQANSNAVEIVADANLALDFLSNGFQLKASYDEINVNNGAYIDSIVWVEDICKSGLLV